MGPTASTDAPAGQSEYPSYPHWWKFLLPFSNSRWPGHCINWPASQWSALEKRRDQSYRRFSWSTSIRFFQLSNPLSSACQGRLLPFLFSSPSSEHTTSVPPSSPPSDHDDLSASLLSIPLCPPHRQLLHIPLSSSSAENTLHVCLFSARSIGTSRRRSDISTFIQDNITSCCWWIPGSALPVMRPRSLTWLCLGTQSSPSPALQGGQAQKAGASLSS